MKLMNLFLFATALGVTHAEAGVLTCSNDDLTVTMRETSPGVDRVIVDMEVAGGGRKAFTFNNVKQLAQSRVVGAAQKYASSELTLTISAEVSIHGTLDVPKLGIKNEAISCK